MKAESGYARGIGYWLTMLLAFVLLVIGVVLAFGGGQSSGEFHQRIEGVFVHNLVVV